MKTDSFRLRATFSATPKGLYDAWLDAERHTLMTGGAATCDARPGGAFSAWDGYISGTNVVLEPGLRIVQRWRTFEFAKGDPDSVLELVLTAVEGGTELALSHSEIPAGQGASYEQGWEDHYFAPMRASVAEWSKSAE